MATAKKSGKVTLFNPDRTPVVYSVDGRSVGGGERVEVDRLDSAGQAMVDQGYLIEETASPAGGKDGAPDQDPTT